VLRALAFLGRHATTCMALGVLAGIALPDVAARLKPLLVPTLLIPLTLALLRLDWTTIPAYRARLPLLAALVAGLLAGTPILVWLATAPLAQLGLPDGLRAALVLMGASSPIVSSVALALILRADAALAAVGVLATTALVPLTLPVMAAMLLGVTVSIDLPTFVLRLAGLVGAAFVAAWLVRRLMGADRIARSATLLDGLTVINLVIFAIAIMDGVDAFARERPGYVATAVAAAFASNLLLQGAGYGLARHLPRPERLTVALMAGNRNMGLVLVALQGQAAFEVTAFFAIAQVPMYVLPALLRRLYARGLVRADGRSPPAGRTPRP
jgi:BASS family bile acid:Na+ symporter